MDERIYMEKVEEVLTLYPKKYSTNYNINKTTIQFEKIVEEFKGTLGQYDPELNKIIYSKNSAISHELFHMAFNDRKKLNSEMYKGLYYSNGVSFYKYSDEKKHFFAKGINEGFADYLAQKCEQNDNILFELFFTELFVSIYGESVISYALDNDPIGFLTDERFFDIEGLIINLDNLYDVEECMVVMSNFKELFSKKNKSKDIDNEIMSLKNSIENKFKNSIINLFNNIINEFNNCEVPFITNHGLLKKMTNFLTDTKYKFAFNLDDENCSVKKEVSFIINEFEESIKSKKYVL